MVMKTNPVAQANKDLALKSPEMKKLLKLDDQLWTSFKKKFAEENKLMKELTYVIDDTAYNKAKNILIKVKKEVADIRVKVDQNWQTMQKLEAKLRG